MRGVETILFDWGGTLVSVHNQDEAWNKGLGAIADCCQRRGLSLDDGSLRQLVDVYQEVKKRADRDPELREISICDALLKWADRIGVELQEDEHVAEMGDAFWQSWVGCLRLLEGADSTLAELKRRGYHLGLVSNVTTTPRFCIAELSRLGIYDVFDFCIFSSAVGYRKPHPAMYRAAIEEAARLGAGVDPGTILFVGDRPSCDIAPPASMGMKTALVVHAQVGAVWSDDEYQSVEPDARLGSINELLELLQSG